MQYVKTFTPPRIDGGGNFKELINRGFSGFSEELNKVARAINRFPLIDVKDYGAKGNDMGNDTSAIQLAFNAVPTMGGIVFFPPGTFLIVPPTTEYIFYVKSNTHIMGCGIGITTIKVKDAAGKYKVIFGPSGALRYNITINDLMIDQNSTNNLVGADITTYKQKLIETTSGSSNLIIDSIEAKDWLGVHVIYSGAAKTNITNSRFTEVGGGDVYFDHSTIYLHAEGGVISDNIFASSGIGSAGAVTAIETHGGNLTATGNTIKNYFIGMNITGVTAIAGLDSENIVINDNPINGAYMGILLWSLQYGEHTTGFGLAGVGIVGNPIRLKQASWTKNPGSGATVLGNAKGISVYTNSDLPLKTLNIANNPIEFDLEDEVLAINSASVGIGYWDATQSNTLSNIKISGNPIINAPGIAIRLSVDGENFEISDNPITNPGSTLGTIADVYHSAIFLSSANALKNVRILNNPITDNLAVARMTYGIYLATASGSELLLDNNPVAVTGGDVSNFIKPYELNTSTQVPLIRGLVIKPALSNARMPTYVVAKTSRIIDVAGDKTWIVKQTGNTWLTESYGTAAPVAGTWNVGDICWNTIPSAGGNIGWICTTAGTPGTWKAFGAIDA